MKSKMVLISSIGSLALTLFLLIAASMAWLSMNRETSSNGMQLQVKVTPNMVISDSTTTLATISGTTEADFSLTFTDGPTALLPCTNDQTYNTYASGLKFVTNLSDVGVTSGLAKADASLTYGSATSGTYFKDYVVYIACVGDIMENMDLTVTLSPTATIASDGQFKQDTLDATSIDFYVATVGSGNMSTYTVNSFSYGSSTYKGTLNVAEYDIAKNRASSTFTTAESDKVSTLTLFENSTIPLNTDDGIVIVMRCYFDGALLKSTSQAFINSEKVDSHDVTLNVTFTATEHSGN